MTARARNKDDFDKRLRIVYGTIFLMGLVIVTRLFFVQVIGHDKYQKQADAQYSVPNGDDFDRGTIFFKEKDGRLISAANLRSGYIVAINPKTLENENEVYEKISKIIDIDKDFFMKHAGKKDDPYEVIAHHVDDDKAKEIASLDIDGLNIYSEIWRYYPAGNLASGVIGFLGYKGDELTGRYGIERFYDSALKRGEEGGFMNSFIEIFSDIKKIISDDFEEGDIVLTIDPVVQSVFEKELQKLNDKYDSQYSGGLIMEPSTGKILAMASKPDFDPNFYQDVDDFSVFKNPSVENIFEPGSIMKALTMAAALDKDAVTPETTYNDKGYIILDKKRIENYDGKARGVVPMQEVLNQSLNTGATFAMQQLGKERFRDYLKNYGLGELTGIDLPGEVRGMIDNVLDSPREVEYATASFGQGIAVTPIAMASALSTLANGGLLMTPYVVDEIKVKNGADIKKEPKVRRRVLKQETSEKISRMLTIVVDDALMGGTEKLEHYTMAAKTGTAQYMEEGSKGYVDGEYIHTFFGYAPSFEARFLVLLYTVKPQGVQYASHSLTEPFMNIMHFLLNYYEVPPDR